MRITPAKFDTMEDYYNFGKRQYPTLNYRPDPLQFLVDDLPWVVLALAGMLFGGLQVPWLHDLILGLSGFLALHLLYKYLLMRQAVYIITDEILAWHHGIIERSVEYIELYRIIDYRERHTFMQQLFGLKTVIIYSGDRTMPQLKIPGITTDCNLVETIRERVEYNRTRKPIYEISNR